MAKRRHTAEQIITKLREGEVELAKGMSLAQVCRKLEIHEQTYYRWRKVTGLLWTHLVEHIPSDSPRSVALV